VALLGVGLTFAYVRYRLGQIKRVACADCTAPSGGPMNVLVVGSDSRARVSTAEAQAFCQKSDCSDQAGPSHSDSIILLHVDPAQGKAAVLSIPRDLNVAIAGTTTRNRVNTAYARGVGTLIQTIRADFGIDVNHFVIVDFVGFQDLVNGMGGLDVYFPTPARDKVSGLHVDKAGCAHLDGTNALGYVRSRHYEFLSGGRWRADPYSDLSRIQRQQDFLRRLMHTALGVRNPLEANSLIGSAVHTVQIDDRLSTGNIITLTRRFRSLSPDTVDMLTLPTDPIRVGGADELRLRQPDASAVIQRFLQQTPPQPVTTTTPAGTLKPKPKTATTTVPARAAGPQATPGGSPGAPAPTC
jgi:LCP family protein required for cell wall assembly